MINTMNATHVIQTNLIRSAKIGVVHHSHVFSWSSSWCILFEQTY